MSQLHCVNIKPTTFVFFYYYFRIGIPGFKMLLQFNDILHFRGEQPWWIFNAELFASLNNSCQESSIIRSRTSLMYNGTGRDRKQQ